MSGSKFENIIRHELIDYLIEFMIPNKRICSINNDHIQYFNQYYKLFSLLKCNKNLQKSILKRIVGIYFQVPLSIVDQSIDAISQWIRFKKYVYEITKINIDDNVSSFQSYIGRVTKITIDINSSSFMNLIKYPKNIKQLSFDHKFNRLLDKNVLPIDSMRNLTCLMFGNKFNQHLENLLPIDSTMNISCIVFGDRFNRPIMPNILPVNLRNLTFGNDFNQPIFLNTFPGSLEYLKFGHNFNQDICFGEAPTTRALPDNLQNLTFGHEFNRYIPPGGLPPHLKHLVFGHDFNQYIYQGVLPEELTHLTFGDGFYTGFDTKYLPRNLKQLTCSKFQHRHTFSRLNVKVIVSKKREYGEIMSLD